MRVLALLSPLLANREYRFEFDLGFVDRSKSPPIDITFFGSTTCDALPFGSGDDFFGCPTNGPGWIQLASKRVSGTSGWVAGQINVTPNQDIYAIAIGPSCSNISTSVSLYYFFDNLVLADERAFEFRISEVNHLCSTEFSLKIPNEQNFQYQWYKEGIALIAENNSTLSQNYGEGKYQVRVTGERVCNLTPIYEYRIPVFFTSIEKTICYNEQFEFGSSQLTHSGEYIDTFKTLDNCDSIVHLSLDVLEFEEEFVSAKIFEGERYEIGNRQIKDSGNYMIELLSSFGCDSLVHLDLDFYQVYFPNIFSPNGDGVNDLFEIHGPDLVEIVEFKIFDRWGALIYSKEQSQIEDQEGWTGVYRGKSINSGAYSYFSKLRMNDQKIRNFSGSVLLIR